MQISMTLPTMLAQGRTELLDWCAAVDAGPWASLAVPERTMYPSHALVPQLAAAAALTERVRLWTTIVILPAHSPVQVAKDMATVDQISAGRLTVGVGVGGREADYRSIGASFERRWQRMDDGVALMRKVWAGEPVIEGGEPVGPPPVQPGGPPIVAGVMGPKALARASHWAAGVDDGTTVTHVNENALAGNIERVRAAWKDAGRSDSPHLSASLWYALGDLNDVPAQERLHDYAYRYLEIFGSEIATMMADAATVSTPEALRDAVDAAANAGCDELFLVPTTTDVTELDRSRDALGI